MTKKKKSRLDFGKKGDGKSIPSSLCLLLLIY